MTTYYALAVAVLATALALSTEHWWVYHVWQRQLPSTVSYALGSATVWSGFFLYSFLSDDVWPAIALGVIYLLAGGMLILMHLTESARDGAGHKREAEALRSVVRDGER